MRRKGLLGIAVVVALVGLVGLWRFRLRETGQPVSPAAARVSAAAASASAGGPPILRARASDAGVAAVPVEREGEVEREAMVQREVPAGASAPGPSAGGPTPTRTALPTAFASERRKDGWAAPREREIRERVAGLIDQAVERGSLRLDLGAVECRYRICQIALSGGDERALARVVDWMGDERGFLNRAEDMHVVRTARGMNVFLRFAR